MANDLSGIFSCNDGGTYFVRQVGSEVYWFGKASGASPGFSNVLHGVFGPNQSVNGSWADVPEGATRSFGVLDLSIQNNDNFTATSNTGGFGGTVWTRID